MRFKSLLPLFLSIACGKKPTDPPPHFPNSPITAKLSLYQDLSDSVRDAHGFIETDACDSLLFSSLASFHKPIDIFAAQNRDSGQWFRTPTHDCYPGHSASSISRDMFIGLLWYAWIHKDLDIANSVYSYAIDHHLVMGDGDPARTLMSPDLLATTAQLVYKLGGSDHTERQLPVTWPPGATDYERHIQTWHILLRMRLYDQLESGAFDRLTAFESEQPNNPLFHYANNHLDLTIQEFMDEQYYPADHLPTSNERCSQWLIERDEGTKGYFPCDDGKIHSGGELLSIGFLMENGL